ncbi:hypothetical protein G4Y79_20890 [Phototrophicus methaneseepsis]|uniref:Phage tail protein n=1 Tax=Phototrophicus methaneseepsis TaxID=2710758 RepID=A0A7S8E855_9CHLR|nr:hypothetical protein [Phototrophicus methaneseepsis]QPC82114.1 hypothetical protein G4Y79_20890 [Phototrophicus methaneseepsis]
MADKSVLTGEDFYLAYSDDGGTTKTPVPGWRRFNPGMTYNEINTEAAGDAIGTGKPGRLMTNPDLMILHDTSNATAIGAFRDAWLGKTSLQIYWAEKNEVGQPLFGLSMYVMDFNISYEDQKEQEINIKLKPADPNWVADPSSATLTA